MNVLIMNRYSNLLIQKLVEFICEMFTIFLRRWRFVERIYWRWWQAEKKEKYKTFFYL